MRGWSEVFVVTSSIWKVVVPKHRCPFGRLHSQVTFIAIPPRVQKVDIIVYEGLEWKKKETNNRATVYQTLWRSEDHQTSEFTQTLKTCTWCTHHLCTPTHIYAPLHHRSCCLPQGMRSPHPPQQSSGRRELWCTWVCNTGLDWQADVWCKETPKHALANQWMAH